jgi:hypothetical protein
MSHHRSDVIAVGLITALACVAVCMYWFGWAVSVPPSPDPNDYSQLISTMYDPPTNAVENALIRGDGQLFAGLATDPLVQRPEMVRGGPSEEAYRYQRPMYGWIGWIASLGQRTRVAWALVTVTVLSVVLLVVLAARWLAEMGAHPLWALAILVMPGVFVDLMLVGPECLGLALVVIGLRQWTRTSEASRAESAPRLGGNRQIPWISVACFAAAGLCRETLLLVPFVLMVASAVNRRLWAAVSVSLAAGPYLAWVLFLRVRIGAWPRPTAHAPALSLLPFGGLLRVLNSWGPGGFVFAAAIIGGAVIALTLGQRSTLRLLVAAHLALAAMLGEAVWIRYTAFGRVLLPLWVLSLLAVAPALAARGRLRALRPPVETLPFEQN